jgi:hypothetical protein
MRQCGLLVNFVELLDLVDVIGLGFNSFLLRLATQAVIWRLSRPS